MRSGKDFDSVRSGGGFRAPHDPALSAEPLPVPRRCHHPQETNLAWTQGQCDARSPNLRHRAPNRKAGSLSTVHQAAQAPLQGPSACSALPDSSLFLSSGSNATMPASVLNDGMESNLEAALPHLSEMSRLVISGILGALYIPVPVAEGRDGPLTRTTPCPLCVRCFRAQWTILCS